MKYLVCAVTRRKAIDFLEELIGEIKYKEIKQIKKSENEMFVELKNGDTYKVISASQSSRGHRCHKAYVERFVDEEIVECVIKPCLLYSDLSQEEQIIYF